MPLHADPSNPSCHRSPAPAPPPVCRPTATRHVCACAAPGPAFVARADSLSAIVTKIDATLIAHPHPPPSALACTGINVTSLLKSEDA
ncbi:hypothetical protein ACQJBY_072648 [Aegilops geniculata]